MTCRNFRFAVAAITLSAAAACAPGNPENGTPATNGNGQTVTQPEVSIGCAIQPGSQPLGERTSSFDSTRITVDGQTAQVCYSRPSARNRTIFGDLVPYDRLWRTGANEPTILHLPFAAEIGGLRVEPGSYSVYTIPGEAAWTVVINRSTSQWGHESTYTPAIQAQEVGRVEVPSERLDGHVETFTIRGQQAGPEAANLIMEWERTRIIIPVRAVS